MENAKHDPTYRRQIELTHIGLLVCVIYLMFISDPGVSVRSAIECTWLSVALTECLRGNVSSTSLLISSIVGLIAADLVYDAAKRQNRATWLNAALALMFPIAMLIFFGMLRKLKK